MALTFAPTTDRVEVAAAASINNLTTFTTLQWIFITTHTDGNSLWGKDPNGSGQKWLRLTFSSEEIEAIVARATTNTTAASGASFFTLNAWNFIACIYDQDGATNERLRLYRGTLSSLIVEEDSYAVQADGAGATDADNDNVLQIGNSSSFTATQGRIATFMEFNKVLTLAEMQAQQFNPLPLSGCVVYHVLGYNGTGTQFDFSGNGNDGTVTGASVGAHVPLDSPFGVDVESPFAAAAAAGLSIPVAMHQYRQQHQSVV